MYTILLFSHFRQLFITVSQCLNFFCLCRGTISERFCVLLNAPFNNIVVREQIYSYSYSYSMMVFTTLVGGLEGVGSHHQILHYWCNVFIWSIIEFESAALPSPATVG